jgi:hypothetical protein
MNVDIYVSATNSLKFVSVRAGQDIALLSLPNDPDLSTLNPRSLDQAITAGSNFEALSTDDMLSQIDKQGYALQLAPPMVGRSGSVSG